MDSAVSPSPAAGASFSQSPSTAFTFPPPPAADASGIPLRIVVALSPRDLDLFLNPALVAHPLGVEIKIVEAPDLAVDGWMQRIEAMRPNVLVTGWTTPPFNAAWLAAPDCPVRYICHVTGSVRQLVPRAFLERGGIVSNWGPTVSNQVAEHGLLLALAALRNLPGWADFIARPPTDRHIADLNTRSLFGRRVGIHGFGSIARALLPLLRPFGVTVVAFSAGVPDEIVLQHDVQPAASLAELFAGADVLFECESLLASTTGTVTAEVLAALPDHAVFVNIGRGGVVEHTALLEEASRGRLRVALDVVDDEPLTVESRLVRSGRIILSPHIAGPTKDRYAACGALALHNLREYLDGRPPSQAISLAGYDRAT